MSKDKSKFAIDWIDFGREPQCPPKPEHPNGVAVDLCQDKAKASCFVRLPHPARRCGIYTVRCKRCGYSVAVTTAGRVDDPKSVRLPCQLNIDRRLGGSGAEFRLEAHDRINGFRVMDGLPATTGYGEILLELHGDKDERRALEMLCGPNGYAVYKLMLLRRNSFRGRLKRFMLLYIGRHWVDWL